MLEPRLFVKEKQLKGASATFGNQLIPILYAEIGQVPSPKGKNKKSMIICNMAGLYFFKSDLRGGPLNFVSTFDIKEIKYVDAKKRVVVCKDDSETTFLADHADEAVAKLVASKNVLTEGYDEQPIALTGFATQPKVEQTTLSEVVVQLRYACYSAKYRVQAGNDVVGMLCQLQKTKSTTLILDTRSPTADDMKCLIMPIVQMRKFKEVVFKNYAPYCVCRAIHYFMKYGSEVTSFVLDGYLSVVPEQLRMDKIEAKNREAVSIALTNCRFSADECTALITEIAKYDGEFQKLVLSGMDMNDALVKNIFRVVKRARGFRTLEILELDGIESMKISREQMTKYLSSLLMHCRFLRKVSMSRWSTPIVFDLNILGNKNVLGEISLVGQNLSAISNRLLVGSNLYLMDLSGALFSGQSLVSLLEAIAQLVNPISLVLRRIVLSPGDWLYFYGEVPKLRRSNKLKELDWSGNIIPEDAIEAFGQYFLADCHVRYLGIDACFGSGEIEQLRKLLSFGKGSLWGLSLGGSTEKNFSGSLPQLCEILSTIDLLYFLNLTGQNITDAEADQLISFLGQKSVMEISCDETHFSDPSVLFSFYERLTQSSVKAIARPIQDMTRFFEGSFAGQMGTNNFDTFVNSVKATLEFTPAAARAYSFCRENVDEAFNQDLFYNCVTKFPLRYLETGHNDKFGLAHQSEKLGSLCLYHSSGDMCHLFSLQSKVLHTAGENPAYRLAEDDSDDVGGAPDNGAWKVSSTSDLPRLQAEDPVPKTPPPPSVVMPEPEPSGLILPTMLPPTDNNDPMGLPPLLLPPAAGGAPPLIPTLPPLGMPGDSTLPLLTLPSVSTTGPNLMQFPLGGMNPLTLPQFGEPGLTQSDTAAKD